MSLGAGEIAIIFILVLVLFGPQRLPELARGLGKGMRELRKATAEIQQQLNLIGEYDESSSKKPQRPLNTRLPSAAQAYNEVSDENTAGMEEQTASAEPRENETYESEQAGNPERIGNQHKEESTTFET
jgi:TatA/E family protein of Tat protein translocase